GMRRLSAELQSLGATPLSEGLDNLWQRVKLWTGAGSPQDDVSVVALEISEDPSFNDHTDASGLGRNRTPSKSCEKSGAASTDGAKCGAISGNSDDKTAPEIIIDNDLATIVAAWRTLLPAIRTGIVAMVRAAPTV
ncbi:MAG: hypothetical protein L0219_09495, partial [Phycisphaerales bacterium]|nr:hypothetical protein [Phycisphaerales bacterium]